MKKATRHQTRAHNKRLVLRTIYQEEELSRADVARATRLTRTTVSDIVSEFIENGLIEETGRGPSEGGKPPVLLSFAAGSRNIIGLDLSNSQFRGGVLDLRGNIIKRQLAASPVDSGSSALERVIDLIDVLLHANQAPILGIGIGTPGLINAREGVVRQAVNLDWRDLPLRRILQERYDLPVYISNDSHAAALGEYVFGQKRQIPNLIVIKVGRGISAGIILNGRLYYGDGSGAGEIGHVRVVNNGSPCLCGHNGCLETVASTRALITQAQQIFAETRDTKLHQLISSPEEITTDILFCAYEEGDGQIKRLVEKAGHYLGIAAAHLVGALNINHIFISGSMSRFGAILVDAIYKEVQEQTMPLLARETEIALSQLGQDIVMLGAASHLLTTELEMI